MTITFSDLASGWYSLDILSARGNGATSGEMTLSLDPASISYWTVATGGTAWTQGSEVTNSGSLDAFGGGATGLGVYAQFNQFYVDDSGTFSLSIKSDGGSKVASINSMILRSVSVPEPSAAFLGLLGMGMLAFRRRRSV